MSETWRKERKQREIEKEKRFNSYKMFFFNQPSLNHLSHLRLSSFKFYFIFFLHLIFDGNLLSLSFQGFATKVSRREKKKWGKKVFFKKKNWKKYIFQPILTVSEKVYHSEWWSTLNWFVFRHNLYITLKCIWIVIEKKIVWEIVEY